MMMELISDHPELRGIFVSDVVLARGAARALAEKKTNMNGDIINLVAFDAEGTLIELVRDGTVAALVIQDPFKMGYDGIKTALAASRGEQMPRNIHTDATVITKANMNAPRPTERLNIR